MYKNEQFDLVVIGAGTDALGVARLFLSSRTEA